MQLDSIKMKQRERRIYNLQHFNINTPNVDLTRDIPIEIFEPNLWVHQRGACYSINKIWTYIV